MAVVTGSAEAWGERNKDQAGQLLRMFNKAKPLLGVPNIGIPLLSGGDHPRPQGLFASMLFAPFVWPEDSETELKNASEAEGQRQKFREGQSDGVHAARSAVFTPGVWQGKGADAANAAYARMERLLNDSAGASKLAKRLLAQAAADVERTKRLMAQANNAMHTEIEAYLRSGNGQSVAQVAVITSKYRATVHAHMADLHTYSAQYTTQFLGQFPLAPTGGGEGEGKGPKVKPVGSGSGSDTWSDAPQEPGTSPTPDGASAPRWDGPTPKNPNSHVEGPHWTDSPTSPSPPTPGKGLPSPLGSAGSLPMSGLPSAPSGGGSGSPLSGLQGLFSGLGFPSAAPMVPTGLGSPSVQAPAPPSTAGLDFGRGLAAGMTAAGGAAAPALGPVPQAPSGPLAVPAASAPTVAVPAAAVSTAAPSAVGAPAPAAGMPAGGLTPYGSVLPPAVAATPAPSAIPSMPGLPGESVSSAAHGPGAGLVPAMGGRAAAAVSRDDSASDVELAKMAVAELAGASCVVDAGLDWAVTVGHNGSGGTTLWVATNDGACYIPPGVFLRNGMSVAAGFDEDFDARWLGWSNPAEKAVRAARAYGDKVGAVATTWAWPSEFLEDPDEGVRQVAIGVPHAGPDGPASELRRTRMHRLQTVSPGLYGDLKALDEAAVRGYCRELVRRVVFGGGPELSPVAQAVAHALVAGGWPKAEEWSALSAEYDAERLMMAAQRPGLNGLEDPAQVVSYHNCFINCRRLEMLLCWKRSDPLMAADVVYAASVAGVRVPILHYVC